MHYDSTLTKRYSKTSNDAENNKKQQIPQNEKTNLKIPPEKLPDSTKINFRKESTCLLPLSLIRSNEEQLNPLQGNSPSSTIHLKTLIVNSPDNKKPFGSLQSIISYPVPMLSLITRRSESPSLWDLSKKAGNEMKSIVCSPLHINGNTSPIYRYNTANFASSPINHLPKS